MVLLVALLVFSDVTFGQDSLDARPKKARTPEDYKLRTLNEIAAAGADIVSESERDGRVDAATLVHGDLLPSRVRVTYKGSARPLTKKRKEVISKWAQRYAGNPDHYTVPYTTEVLFREDAVDHWLVVSKKSVSELRKKLKRGVVVDLYLIRLGAFKTSGKWKWVLLVEDFGPPGSRLSSFSLRRTICTPAQKARQATLATRLPHLSLAHLIRKGASEGRSICPLRFFGNSFTQQRELFYGAFLMPDSLQFQRKILGRSSHCT